MPCKQKPCQTPCEDLAFDDGTNAEVVENFSAVLPWVGVTVLSNGFIIEAIHGGDLSGLVVTSKESDVGWVLELEAKEELECFTVTNKDFYK